MSDTVCPASLVWSKKATSVRTASGRGITRSTILVATPSVPSEPTNAPTRSYPGRSTSLPPSSTTTPSGSTTSRPVT